MRETVRGGRPTGPVHVAEYVRMSTEHQRYSIEGQSAALREFADANGMVIVRTYSDAGKSGLRLHKREALQQLLVDVQSPDRDFAAVLVFDVSRWGRFQDVDESAYYEFLCRRSGVRVLYCAEHFADDSSPLSAVVKSIKRAMAGEYSRELSAKVSQGQARLVRRGFHQGAIPGYGLRRMLVDESGAPKGIMEPGEHKSLSIYRTKIVPGPPNEVAVVRRVFDRFANSSLTLTQIAAELNAEGVRTASGARWSNISLRCILNNERYIGSYVYNRTSQKLRGKSINNPPSEWVRTDGCFEGFIDPALFRRAQQRFTRRPHWSKEECIAAIRRLAEQVDRVSCTLLDKNHEVPSARQLRLRFGCLAAAFALAGLTRQGRIQRPARG